MKLFDILAQSTSRQQASIHTFLTNNEDIREVSADNIIGTFQYVLPKCQQCGWWKARWHHSVCYREGYEIDGLSFAPL